MRRCALATTLLTAVGLHTWLAILPLGKRFFIVGSDYLWPRSRGRPT